MTFIKLSSIPQFTVKEYKGFKWKKWDKFFQNPNGKVGKMFVSDEWQEGYNKAHTIEAVEGTLDLSGHQIGNMLECVLSNGVANLIGHTFGVKMVKTGDRTTYYFSILNQRATPTPKTTERPFKTQASLQAQSSEELTNEDLQNIPF